MKSYNKSVVIGFASVLAAALLTACSGKEDSAPKKSSDDEPTPAITNRIDLPLAARNNLGIRFVKAESRRLAVEKRYPGAVELLPGAKVAIAAPLAGKVSFPASRSGAVAANSILFDVEAPSLRELRTSLVTQRYELTKASADVTQARAEVEAARPVVSATEAQRAAALRLREAQPDYRMKLEAAHVARGVRVTELEKLQAQGAGKASELSEARAALTEAATALAAQASEEARIDGEIAAVVAERERAAADVASKEAALTRAEAAESAARAQFHQQVTAAEAQLAALGVQPLPSITQDAPWENVPGKIQVRAPYRVTVVGVSVSDGAWLEAGAEAVTVLQAGSHTVRVSLPSSVAAATTAATRIRLLGSDPAQFVEAGLERAPESSSASGMVDFLVRPQAEAAWLTPGTSAIVEVTLAEAGASEVVVPRAAIIQDGLEFILFRRDPANPDKVIRLAADIGLMRSDFVSLRSGVGAGDELVTDGIYELKLMGQGKAAAGGHFHADGTFHAGSH